MTLYIGLRIRREISCCNLLRTCTHAGKSSVPGAAPGRWGMRAPALQKPQAGERRTLALKDLIATLERDPNYSRSTFLYKLYERLD